MGTDIILEIARSVLNEIEELRQTKQHLLVAVDGRCASGKTTLAGRLKEACGCNVIHMDHFFPRPEQRTAKRLSEPGGNVDYERFLAEVLPAIRQGEAFSYRPYDCRSQELMEPIRIEPHPVNVIEGSYSCHPALYDSYDLRIFLTVGGEEQLRRIRLRNGEARAVMFREKWIPMEELYFAAFNVAERCDLHFRTGS